jgi:hypothetical protein
MFQAAEDGVVTAVKWYPAGASKRRRLLLFSRRSQPWQRLQTLPFLMATNLLCFAQVQDAVANTKDTVLP